MAGKLLGVSLLLVSMIVLTARSAHAGGCSGTQELIRKAIDDAGACSSNSDCISLDMGCPFGCAVLVNKSSKEALLLLKADYPNRCDPCEFKCSRHPKSEIVCRENRCIRDSKKIE